MLPNEVAWVMKKLRDLKFNFDLTKSSQFLTNKVQFTKTEQRMAFFQS